jgi:ribosome assembly protein RRB1
MGEGGHWAVDQRPLTGHTASVEDIQWSPSEENVRVVNASKCFMFHLQVFASCSADGSIRLWDARAAAAEACVCTVANAHSGDVNVISWNSTEPFLLSGGDDGELKIWDLKLIQVSY